MASDQLTDDRPLGLHDVVAQQNGKGLVSHKTLGPPDGVAQSLGLLLPNVKDVGQVGGPPHLGQLVVLARLNQAGLQFGVIVKIVVHGRFGPVGDDQDVLNSCGHRLFDDILNHRLVHQGKHLLGHGLGGGQHTGPQPGGRDDGFFDLHR